MAACIEVLLLEETFLLQSSEDTIHEDERVRVSLKTKDSKTTGLQVLQIAYIRSFILTSEIPNHWYYKFGFSPSVGSKMLDVPPNDIGIPPCSRQNAHTTNSRFFWRRIPSSSKFLNTKQTDWFRPSAKAQSGSFPAHTRSNSCVVVAHLVSVWQ